jgi:uncharacterized protein YndB with AHSA1/START domain
VADRAVETLVVRQTIRATPERLFQAWTTPAQLLQWWGPVGVTCVDPAVDLRVGGRYRIGNRLPDGTMLWIGGEFELIDPPHALAYTWRVEGSSGATERVTVRFAPKDGATEVTVTHERIANRLSREQHEYGWRGCLTRLAAYVESATRG